jgi:hypothetical protein
MSTSIKIKAYFFLMPILSYRKNFALEFIGLSSPVPEKITVEAPRANWAANFPLSRPFAVLVIDSLKDCAALVA